MTDLSIIEGLNEAMGLNIAKSALEIEVVRALREADLGVAPKPAQSTLQLTDLRRIRPSHHNAAKLLAKGRTLTDVALICGYTVAHVSNLRDNPAFMELVDYYRKVDDHARADVEAQMEAVGLEALGILRDRLEEKPDEFTVPQLHGTIDLLLVKGPGGGRAGGPGLAPAAGPSVNISFVSPAPPSPKDITDAEYVVEPRK